ncbi:MAG: dTDP-4-dehydrorhamnose reductase [Bacteroidales bacterium]|nr:dTDP-4-dehydrorhamnose reductase [Bacteroidales bacterium]
MSRTILVTGSNGQLGIEIRKAAGRFSGKQGKSACRYIFTDVNDLPGFETVHLDITDEDAVMAFMRRAGVDAVVNCAAYTDVEKAEGNPETADLLNHIAVAGIAEAARECDAVMIHISTDYVFSGDACAPYSEMDETSPASVYGITKLAGERAVVNSGCRYIIFRTAWLYSANGRNFVKTILKASREKEKLDVVFDQVGSPTYAGDLAALIVKVLEKGMLDRQGIYHFTDEGVCSWYDFAREICWMSGRMCDVRPCHSSEFPSKVRRPHYSVLDKTLVKKTFGVTIPHWRTSLAECLSILGDTRSQKPVTE